MARDLEKKIRRCARCLRSRARPEKAPMNTIQTSYPLELVSIDYLTIDEGGQKQNILVISDHFTLISMLRSLTNEEKKTWRKHLRAAVHAYNARIQEATGYSPYLLFFGRHPRLPIDLAFGVEVRNATSTKPSKYVEKLREELARAHTRAKEQMDRQADRNKLRYDRSAHAADLEAGDRVLVRRVGHLMKSKIDDRWEDEVYIISSRKGELPVYSVRRESGDGPTRTLHRNLLLPIGWVGL